jgi:DNA-binding NarL/FixJ family response regulator
MNGQSNNVFKKDTEGPLAPDVHEHFNRLTRREREILSLIAQGRANKEIAERLAISVRTVEAHRAKIMRKLDIHSHAGLIYYAMRGNITNML